MIYNNQAFKGGYFDVREFERTLLEDLAFEAVSDIDTSTRLVTGTTATAIHDVSIDLDEDEIALAWFNANVSQNVSPPATSQIILISDGLESVTKNFYFNQFDLQISARGSLMFTAKIVAFGKPSGAQTEFEAQAKTASGAGSEFRVFNSQWLILIGKKQRHNDRLFT